ESAGYRPGERPKDEPEMQYEMQQLPQVNPARDRPDQAEKFGLLMVYSGLSVYGVDPPERKAQPKKRHQQPNTLRPREGSTRASQAHHYEITDRDNRESRTELPDKERANCQPAPDSEI